MKHLTIPLIFFIQLHYVAVACKTIGPHMAWFLLILAALDGVAAVALVTFKDKKI